MTENQGRSSRCTARRLVIVCGVCLLILGCGTGGNAGNPAEARDYDSLLEDGTDVTLGGIGACLFSDRDVLWRYRSPEGGGRVAFDERSEIHLGELSKQFTIMAVRRLCAEGKLDPEAPLSLYLPGLFTPDVAERLSGKLGSLTIRSILAEASGYADRPIPSIDYRGDREDFGGRLEAARPLFRPGLRRSESALMMNVVGMLVEKASGGSFDRFVREEVFSPLGMKASSFAEDSSPPAAARFYHQDGGAYLDSSSALYNYLDPAYSMRSTLADLARCYEGMLRMTRERGSKKAETFGVPAVFSPAIRGQLNREGYESGEGWILTDPELDAAGAVAWAGGSYLSHRVVVILARDYGLGIVLAGNVYNKAGIEELRAAGARILMRSLELRHGIHAAEFAPPSAVAIPERLASMPGLYASAQGTAIVAFDHGRVTVSCNGGYSAFAYSESGIFLPTVNNAFREMEAIDPGRLTLRWKSGAERSFEKPSFETYGFLAAPREGSFRQREEAWSGSWSISSQGPYFTIQGGDGREYLLVPSSPGSAGILCDEASLFYQKELTIGSDGETAIGAARAGS